MINDNYLVGDALKAWGQGEKPKELPEDANWGRLGRLALQELSARGQGGEAPSFFSFMARFPTHRSFFLYWQAYSSVGNGSFESVGDLAESVLQEKTWSDNWSAEKLWIEFLLDVGEYGAAEKFLDYFPETPQSTYWRLRFASLVEESDSTVPVQTVNLAWAQKRWELQSVVFDRAGYRSLTRCEAVNGKALPQGFLNRIVSKPSIPGDIGLGAVGAWLSHYKRWEEIASSDHDYVVVIEDDMVPHSGPGRLGRLVEKMEAQGLDFLWVASSKSRLPYAIWKWDDVFLDPYDLVNRGSSMRTGWGADGYILTPETAAVFLELAEKQLISGHVDGQLAAWTTAVTSEPRVPLTRSIKEFQAALGKRPSIKAASLAVPIVKTLDFGSTTR